MAKKYAFPFLLLDRTGVGVETKTSSAYKIPFGDNIGIQFIWANGASTPAGSFKIEATNAKDPDSSSAKWFTLTVSDSLAISGNSGSLGVALPSMPWHALRVSYTGTAGTVDVQALASSKAL